MIVLMQCVAEAVMHKGIRGLAELVPGATYLYEVANESLKRLKERKRLAELRNEVMSAANASLEEVKRTAAEVARDVAAAGPIEDRIALEMYLTQIPGAIRQSLKRPDDPSGKTVPVDLAFDDPAELLRRLPQRVARFRPGDSLPGKPGWKLVEFLGSGGFGEVWLARNPTLTALQGAVKFGLDPAARERLLRHEGTLINRVMEHGRHPNVVQLLDAHLEGDSPWLMYEYVHGGDLGGLVLEWQSLPPDERAKRVIATLRTLAAAVSHFHKLTPPLVHRDLKPANVLLANGGRESLGGAELKIADFGIGGVAAAASLALEASRKGSTHAAMSQLAGAYTPLYASPQQQRGEPPDPRDDVHALGVIGFQMLTGKLDTTLGTDYAKTLRRLGVPESLIELLGDCAAHDPANRPGEAQQLVVRLERIVNAPTLSFRKQSEVQPRIAIAKHAAPKPQPTEPTPELPSWRAVMLTLMFLAGVGLCLLSFAKSPRPVMVPPADTTPGLTFTKIDFIRAIKLQQGKVSGLRVSPDGKLFAALVTPLDAAPNVTVWRTSDGESIATIPRKGVAHPGAFAFNAESQRIALTTADGVSVVSATSGDVLFSLKTPVPTSIPSWVGYSPNGQWILTNTGKVFAQYIGNPGVAAVRLKDSAGSDLVVNEHSRLVFDPQGTLLAVVRPGIGPTVVYAVEGWKYLFQIGTKADHLCAFTPGGDALLTWRELTVSLWSTKSGEQTINHAVDPYGDELQLLVSDKEQVVAVGTRATISFTLGRRGTQVEVPGANGSAIRRAVFDPSGTNLATVSEHGSLGLCPAAEAAKGSTSLFQHSGIIHDAQFSQDGTVLFAIGTDGIFLWSVTNPKRPK